jgi:hypothetical protein
MIIAALPELSIPLASLLPHSATPYLALTIAGFALGTLGHLAGERWLVAAGVILICLGALLLPLGLYLTESTPPEIERVR